MTKKSLGRLQRDQEKSKLKDARNEAAIQIKGNNVYDDIRSVYTECGRTLAGYAQSFNELGVQERLPHMDPDQLKKVTTLAHGFSSDVGNFTEDLLVINAPFEKKVGGEENLDSFVETVGVIDQFQEFIGRASAVLDPTFRSIAAEIIEVDTRLAAMNPVIITDVEVKEVPTEEVKVAQA